MSKTKPLSAHPTAATYAGAPYRMRAIKRDGPFGFVSGVISKNKLLTEAERRAGKEGFTADEWEALSARNGGATLYPLKLNHKTDVGYLLETHVDRRGRMCGSAKFDMESEEGRRAYAEVEAGRLHSFSIGFRSMPASDWDPVGGNTRYVNFDLEASLTDDPVDPDAIINTFCSRNADTTDAADDDDEFIVNATTTTNMDVDPPAATAAAATPAQGLAPVIPIPSIAELQARLAAAQPQNPAATAAPGQVLLHQQQQQPATAAALQNAGVDPSKLQMAMDLLNKPQHELAIDLVRAREEQEAERKKHEEDRQYMAELRKKKEEKRERREATEREATAREIDENKEQLRAQGINVDDETEILRLVHSARHPSTAPLYKAMIGAAKQLRAKEEMLANTAAERDAALKRASTQDAIKELVRAQLGGNNNNNGDQAPVPDGKRAAVSNAWNANKAATKDNKAAFDFAEYDADLMRALQSGRIKPESKQHQAAAAASAASASEPLLAAASAKAAADAASGRPADLDEVKRQMNALMDQAHPIVQKLLEAQDPIARAYASFQAILNNVPLPTVTKCSHGTPAETPEGVYQQTYHGSKGVPFMPSQNAYFLWADYEEWRAMARNPEIVASFLPGLRMETLTPINNEPQAAPLMPGIFGHNW